MKKVLAIAAVAEAATGAAFLIVPSLTGRLLFGEELTGVGGGHRDVYEHLNRLGERGHDVALYTLGSPPEWFPLAAPVHTFEVPSTNGRVFLRYAVAVE